MKKEQNSSLNKTVCNTILKDSELNKLKIKIQNNSELITIKDQQIEQLKFELRKNNSQSPPSPPKLQQNGKSITSTLPISNKINDLQLKLSFLIQNQNKLGQKMSQLGSKVEYVEKGLLSILACKMANMQNKISQFADKSTQRINNLEYGIANKLKKDGVVNLKQVKASIPNNNFSPSIQSLAIRIEGLRQEVVAFKQKQFRYQNSNVINLKKDLNMLKHITADLQKRFQSVHNRLKNSKCSSRRNYDSTKKNTSFHSNFFDDYEEVYQQLDSLGQDQFFHPLQQSAKKNKAKQSCRPTHHQSIPNTHNDSFQNFTSEEQQEDSPNIKRLSKALKQGLYKLPVHIQVDLTGFIRKKMDQKYLVDTEKKGFVLSTVQLNQCRQKGLLIW